MDPLDGWEGTCCCVLVDVIKLASSTCINEPCFKRVHNASDLPASKALPYRMGRQLSTSIETARGASVDGPRANLAKDVPGRGVSTHSLTEVCAAGFDGTSLPT